MYFRFDDDDNVNNKPGRSKTTNAVALSVHPGLVMLFHAGATETRDNRTTETQDNENHLPGNVPAHVGHLPAKFRLCLVILPPSR